MFFEGAEKKAEVQIHQNELSLLTEIDDTFWHRLVEHCGAKVLSSTRNECCKAFLLSESSLFVWDNRFLLITCGQTQLVKALEFFVQTYGRECIRQLTYQRKNEYFSHDQPSCFGDDVKLLTQYLEGRACRFGALDGHHNFIFHYENQFDCDAVDKTYELLVYQICDEASDFLSREELSSDAIREFLKLDQLLAGFEIDDFVFEPYGYSLNAIHGDTYLTIHITPQAGSSYVSVESNLDLIERAPKLLSALKPRSFDLLTYNELEFETKIEGAIPKHYVASTKFGGQLTNGYDVRFTVFAEPAKDYRAPHAIDIDGDYHAL